MQFEIPCCVVFKNILHMCENCPEDIIMADNKWGTQCCHFLAENVHVLEKMWWNASTKYLLLLMKWEDLWYAKSAKCGWNSFWAGLDVHLSCKKGSLISCVTSHLTVESYIHHYESAFFMRKFLFKAWKWLPLPILHLFP